MTKIFEPALLTLVDQFLADSTAFRKFEHEFQDYYLDRVPDDGLDDRQDAFFLEIHERLDWTVEQPDAESRSFGYVDVGEFTVWLRDARLLYAKTGGPLDGSST
jgi:hypothetical protein